MRLACDRAGFSRVHGRRPHSGNADAPGRWRCSNEIVGVRRFSRRGSKGLRPRRLPHPQLRRRRTRHAQLDLPLRGAEVGNMNEFVRDFGSDRRREARAELSLAGQHPRRGQLDHRAEQGAPGQATSGPPRARAKPLRVYAAANDAEEARFIVDEVRALHREGMNLSDMALLYRSNAQSRILEHSLFPRRRRLQGLRRLAVFERQEVKACARLPEARRECTMTTRRSRAS